MDSERLRTPARRVVNSSEEYISSEHTERTPVAHLPRDEGVVRPAPRTPLDAPGPKRRTNSIFVWIVVAFLALLIGAGLTWFFSRPTAIETGIDNSKYQAVFLSNGQHYFGKLSILNDGYLKLTDVYYLESADEDTAKKQVELRKLGETEIHAPEDTMIISKDQVLMYENLKGDGQVVKSIDQHKQQAR